MVPSNLMSLHVPQKSLQSTERPNPREAAFWTVFGEDQGKINKV